MSGLGRRLRRADDRATDAVGRGRSTAWGRALEWSSHTARGGSAWFAVAAASVALGKDRRRSAVALGAWAAAESSGLAVKWAFRRRRPPSSDPAQPSSPSFPSTHAAGGVAFAVTYADRSLVDLAVAGLALAVAGGRVVQRDHYVGDVIGGTVLGAVIGSVGRRLAR
ncbi:phosphatase PAP2 family protein [Dermatobacter hominis]|uniref:phosphatase PAP2 family protein n=1 Tax=Dermatobacter hominis TaxID=2884263 RepID=UPI001D12333B|nr:phosphatase PAP2 family protein [Dermatobacter hominis]UDY37567.1 phosphatase PAP2 family protein [Dermatobacter hominis]